MVETRRLADAITWWMDTKCVVWWKGAEWYSDISRRRIWVRGGLRLGLIRRRSFAVLVQALISTSVCGRVIWGISAVNQATSSGPSLEVARQSVLTAQTQLLLATPPLAMQPPQQNSY